MIGLSAETIARLKARAADPATRCDTSAMHANSVSSDDVWSGMRDRIASHDEETQRGIREYMEGVNSPLKGMMVNALFGDGSGRKGLEGMLGALMGGKASFAMMGGQTVRTSGSDAPEAASPPASEKEVEAAEAALGFALPTALRHFYREVADGGVGMGDGIYSLDGLVEKYRKLTREPAGPQGQDWPANLLPIQGEDFELVSIDRDSGKLVFWDMEELDDDEDLPPDNPTWAKSFKPEADSLEAWLGEWLGEPAAGEGMQRRAADELAQAQTRAQADVERVIAANPEYARRLEIFSMTPEQRRALGLPDKGWEDKVWEGFDWNSLQR